MLIHIGNYAFMYCTNLRSVKLPSSLLNFKESAFLCCPIVNVTIEKGCCISEDDFWIIQENNRYMESDLRDEQREAYIDSLI